MGRQPLDRREALTVAGVSIATAVTGCIGGNSSGNNTSGTGGSNDGGTDTESANNGSGSDVTSQSEIVENLTYKQNHIAISYATDANITGFTLVSAKGERFDETRVSPGESFAKLPLKTSTEWAPPGNYTLNVFNGQEIVEEHQLHLESNVEVTDFELVKTNSESDFEDEPKPDYYSTVKVTVKNTGNLTARITHLGMPKGVLEPTNSSQVDLGELPNMKDIGPGESMNLKVRGGPLYFSGSSAEERLGAKQTVVEDASWEEAKSAWCNGKETRARLTLKGKGMENRVYTATLRWDGDLTRRSATDFDAACTNVTVVDEWTMEKPTTTS